jgi:hypothetical protein
VTPEVSREVRLVVEPDTRRHLRDGLAVEQAPARGVDPSRHDVSVRAIPKVRVKHRTRCARDTWRICPASARVSASKLC